MATHSITDKFIREQIEQALAGKFTGNRLYYDGHKDAPRGFALRVTQAGVAAFVVNYYADGRERRATLGRYGKVGSQLSIAAARMRAAKLRHSVQAGVDPLAEKQAKRDAAKAAREEAKAKHGRSLGALLLAYVGQLERGNKLSARSVELTLRLHVENAFPKLWAAPADDITDVQLVSVLARMTDAGKLSQASKLRAYFRAAYLAANRARLAAGSLPALRELQIKTNPARDLAPITGSNNARDRALSVAELRAYWRRIAKIQGADGALLRFHLLTGGQRLEQLARIATENIDYDADVVTLLDPKGRRTTPRVHVVPLIDEAKNALQDMAGKHGEYAFSADGGKTGASYFVVANRLEPVIAAMREAGELEGADFTLGDLRRTVETRLAGAGVSKEVRAHLQSHGLGGIQSKHYDRHDYLKEKRAALETLRGLLEPARKANNVARLRTKRA